MSGIYIHIPFCKQACTYCDFHFSTNLSKKEDMIRAIAAELYHRKTESQDVVETIYFGGGTPSVLSVAEINFLIEAVYANYTVSADPEITVEANPDDLTSEKINQFSQTKINRLSVGVQSFFDADLKLMNRAHNASEALKSIEGSVRLFPNITIDLIYGIPGMSNERWRHNVQTAIDLGVPHISAYALTVEPKTALKKLIENGKVIAPRDEVAENHFHILREMLEANGFIQYEISNFGKPGYFSRNNSAYWLGKRYIGVGPSAHSYDGKHRSWNVANNSFYLKGIASGKPVFEREVLSAADRYNEYVMTGLRTIWGVSIDKIKTEFGIVFSEHLLRQSHRFVNQGFLVWEDEVLKATPAGKFLTDGLASDLFMV
ncbi:radical SAM family heme chaperone HemW [Flavobacterium silvaticum]|uniref:Heme chaperone HemW n=1 Tax=Flavobacterium silvaticum TaxID=1852020 RepID=A0A972G117_9FLAO|nr:radical SAM family heme chaperone HemW [Flavobacterium silvaticum]NMH28476.1 radical SAM family heme chaperone HemW [Flavobacterium silvaticum]